MPDAKVLKERPGPMRLVDATQYKLPPAALVSILHRISGLIIDKNDIAALVGARGIASGNVVYRLHTCGIADGSDYLFALALVGILGNERCR